MPVFGCVVERDASSDVIVIGTAYGIFTTDNVSGSSTTWSPCNDEIGPIPVFDVCQQWRDWEEGDSLHRYRRVENPGAIYACTHGRGVWRADNLLSNQDIDADEPLTSNPVSLNVFPNPSSDLTTINFSIPPNKEISLDVYDLNGKKVKSILSNNVSNGGIYNIPLDISFYPLGTYIIVLSSDNTSKVAKFIKY